MPAYILVILLAGAIVPSAGCQPTGELSLELVLPTDAALRPEAGRIAQVTLVTREPGGPAVTETRTVSDAENGLDMGAVLADQELELGLELRSATERLIGYGETAGVIRPVRDETNRVAIQVRRPFVYVSGRAGTLDAFDASLDPGEGHGGGTIDDVGQALVSAPSADGSELVVVSVAGDGIELSLVRTLDHRRIDAPPIPLDGVPEAVSDLAVSADGRLALVGHDGEGGGLSVVDLDAARQGDRKVAFSPVGAVGAVAMVPSQDGSPDRAVMLLDRSRAFGCDARLPASSLALLILTGDLPVDATVELDGPTADLAVSPAGDAIFVAEPCDDRIGLLKLGAGAPGAAVELLELESATSVTALGDRLWAAGAAVPSDATGARLVLASSAIDGAGVERFELAPAEERAESTDFEDGGQRVEVRVEADRLRAFDLVALPGGDVVALLTEAYFHADESGDFGGSPIIPEMEVTSFEYLLIDVATRTPIQRLRTFCEGFVLTDAIFTSFRCGVGSDQAVVADADAYRPIHMSALYGGK